MNLYSIIFGLCVLIFSGCENGNNKKTENNIVSTDTVIRDIPEWLKANSFQQIKMKKINNMLNLQSIQDGFNGFQVRVWIGCNNIGTNLIEIKEYQSEWSAKIYSYQTDYYEGDSFRIRDVRVESKSPKSGWKNFSDSLEKTEINNLPDYSKLYPKYNLPTDADGVLVEIASPKIFRLYSYPELGLNKTITEGPAKLEKALSLIEREFDYKRPCQD